MTNDIRRRLLHNLLKMFDIGVMAASFLFAALAVLQQTRNVGPADFFSMRIKVLNFGIFSGFVFVWYVIFKSSGLYRSRRLLSPRRDVIDAIAATSLGSIVILVTALVFRVRLVTPLFMTVFWLATMFCTFSSRLGLRFVLGLVRRRGRNLRQIVVVGTNARALHFADALRSRPELGYRIHGFVDQAWPGIENLKARGYTVLSDIETFPEFLRSCVVDEVVVALPFRSMHEHASRIAACCEEQGVTVRVLSNVFNLKSAHASSEELEGHPLLTHSTGWTDGWPIVVKRALDITLSLVALIVLSPVLLLAAILIKLTSSGPILFVQKRVGWNKRTFDLYKFRTMVADAESRIREVEHLNEVRGPVFKIKNDPRITKTGRFLRKTSIDELPQLVNVLMGDMSLVGPRPLPIRDCSGFNEDIHRRRFSVKPGITCLWQVLGRNSIPFEQWMELDLQYIDRWSLWLDFQILMRTIPAVLRGSGAA